MGTKGRKAKQPAGKQGNAGKLQKLIEEVIQAENRGDPDESRQAVKALDKFGDDVGSDQLRNTAVEARMAAQNEIAVDRVRLLKEIAARLATRP
jgi:hypothetical protein